MKKNIMVIINPQSGKADAKKYENIIKDNLNDYFDEIDIQYTKEKGDGTNLAKEASDKKYHSVCAVGGDGTIAEVINGLVDYDTPPNLLLFPAGTGNILSKQLGMEQNKNNALKNIDFDNPKFFDIGTANDKAFSFMLSIGQIPEALHEVSNQDKEKFGFIAYFTNVLRNITNDNNYQLEVKVDDNHYSGVVDHLFIATSDNYGGFKIKQVESSVDDGLLNVFIVKDTELFNKAKAGLDVLFGNEFDNEIVEFYQGKKISIKSIDDQEITVDLDGDEGPKLPIDIEVISKKIKIYIPKKN